MIAGFVQREKLGEFYSDRAWIINREAGVSNEPDAAFATWETLKSKKLAPPADRADDDRFELIGTPDWICEIVSDSSEKKDYRTLLKAYRSAGIREYWLIDARGEEIEFQLHVWALSGYRAPNRETAGSRRQSLTGEFQLRNYLDTGIVVYGEMAVAFGVGFHLSLRNVRPCDSPHRRVHPTLRT